LRERKYHLLNILIGFIMENKNRAIAKKCFLQGYYDSSVCFWYDPKAEDIDATYDELMEMVKAPEFRHVPRAMLDSEIEALVKKTRKYSAIRVYVEKQCSMLFNMHSPRDSANRVLLRLDNGISPRTISMEMGTEIAEQYPQKPMWVNTLDDIPPCLEGYRNVVIKAMNDNNVDPISRSEIDSRLKDLKKVERLRSQIPLDVILDGFKKIQRVISLLFFPYIQEKLKRFCKNLEILCASKANFADTHDAKIIAACKAVFKPVVEEDKIIVPAVNFHVVMLGNRGKGYHVQIDPTLYHKFEDMGYVTEGFSGPYNHTMRLYYSPGPMDRYFGSLGNFFSVNKYGRVLINPPFDVLLIDKMFKHLVSSEGEFIIFLPYKDEIMTFLVYYKSFIKYQRIIAKENIRFRQFWEKGCEIGCSKLFTPVNDIIVLSIGEDRCDRIDTILDEYSSEFQL